MEQNIDEKKVISKLFVSKEKIAERLTSLVNLSAGMISIVEETGEIYLENSGNLNNNEKIFLFLLGSYFSWKSGFRKDPNMSLGELADKLSVPNTTIPAPMNNLLSEKAVVKTRKGSYSINFDNYKIIKEILLKIKKKNDKS